MEKTIKLKQLNKIIQSVGDFEIKIIAEARKNFRVPNPSLDFSKTPYTANYLYNQLMTFYGERVSRLPEEALINRIIMNITNDLPEVYMNMLKIDPEFMKKISLADAFSNTQKQSLTNDLDPSKKYSQNESSIIDAPNDENPFGTEDNEEVSTKTINRVGFVSTKTETSDVVAAYQSLSFINISSIIEEMFKKAKYDTLFFPISSNNTHEIIVVEGPKGPKGDRGPGGTTGTSAKGIENIDFDTIVREKWRWNVKSDGTLISVDNSNQTGVSRDNTITFNLHQHNYVYYELTDQRGNDIRNSGRVLWSRKDGNNYEVYLATETIQQTGRDFLTNAAVEFQIDKIVIDTSLTDWTITYEAGVIFRTAQYNNFVQEVIENSTKISDNETNIATNTGEIRTLKTDSAAHKTGIANLNTRVNTEARDIVTNKNSINSNTNSIRTNTTNINTNKNSITHLGTRVTANQTKIGGIASTFGLGMNNKVPTSEAGKIAKVKSDGTFEYVNEKGGVSEADFNTFKAQVQNEDSILNALQSTTWNHPDDSSKREGIYFYNLEYIFTQSSGTTAALAKLKAGTLTLSELNSALATPLKNVFTNSSLSYGENGNKIGWIYMGDTTGKNFIDLLPAPTGTTTPYVKNKINFCLLVTTGSRTYLLVRSGGGYSNNAILYNINAGSITYNSIVNNVPAGYDAAHPLYSLKDKLVSHYKIFYGFNDGQINSDNNTQSIAAFLEPNGSLVAGGAYGRVLKPFPDYIKEVVGDSSISAADKKLITDNDTRSKANDTRSKANETKIGTNTTNIGTNTTKLTTNTANIATNTINAHANRTWITNFDRRNTSPVKQLKEYYADYNTTTKVSANYNRDITNYSQGNWSYMLRQGRVKLFQGTQNKFPIVVLFGNELYAKMRESTESDFSNDPYDFFVYYNHNGLDKYFFRESSGEYYYYYYNPRTGSGGFTEEDGTGFPDAVKNIFKLPIFTLAINNNLISEETPVHDPSKPGKVHSLRDLAANTDLLRKLLFPNDLIQNRDMIIFHTDDPYDSTTSNSNRDLTYLHRDTDYVRSVNIKNVASGGNNWLEVNFNLDKIMIGGRYRIHLKFSRVKSGDKPNIRAFFKGLVTSGGSRREFGSADSQIDTAGSWRNDSDGRLLASGTNAAVDTSQTTSWIIEFAYNGTRIDWTLYVNRFGNEDISTASSWRRRYVFESSGTAVKADDSNVFGQVIKLHFGPGNLNFDEIFGEFTVLKSIDKVYVDDKFD